MDSQFKLLLAGDNWAQTGDREDPADDPNLSRATGWPSAYSSTDAPTRTIINQLLRELYGAARESALGVSQYDAEVSYPVGSVCQVNGRLFYAAQANNPSNLSTPGTLNNTTWVAMGGIGDAPSAPSTITVDAIHIDASLADRFAVYWSEPANGNSPITSVDLRYSKTSTFPAASTTTLTNYTAGTSIAISGRDSDLYYVGLRFNNAISDTDGGATWGPAKQVLSSPLTTDAVVAVSATGGVGNGNVDVSWSPPYTRGLSVSSYKVQWKSGSESFGNVLQATTSSTSFRITGLFNNTEYSFRVIARSNRNTDSPASVVVTATPTKPDVPTAPAITTEATALNSVQVYLASIPNDNGAKITRFQWQLKNSGDAWSNADAITEQSTEEPFADFTGLVANTAYHIRARAYNGASDSDSDPSTGDSGWSLWSATSNINTLSFTTPSAPTISASKPAPGHTIIYGLADDIGENGGADVSAFDVDYRDEDSNTWIELRALASAFGTITGLEADTTYQIRMRASNGTLTSGWSDTLSVSTTGAAQVPGKPVAFAAVFVPMANIREIIGAVGASFTDGPITQYQFQSRTERGGIISDWTTYSGSANPYLRRTTNYLSTQTWQIRVRMRNATGWSVWSDIVSKSVEI